MIKSDSSPLELTREQILAALAVLNRELDQRGVMGELCIFGGAVMVLAFNARLATRDVDAVFQPAGVVRELAGRVGADIACLIRHLKRSSPVAVMDIVSAYYPPDRVPVKAQFLVETIFEEGRI